MIKFDANGCALDESGEIKIFEQDTQSDSDTQDIAEGFPGHHVFNFSDTHWGDLYLVVPGNYDDDPLTANVVNGAMQIVHWDNDDDDESIIKDVTADYETNLRAILKHLQEHWQTCDGKLAINCKNSNADQFQIELAREELAGSFPNAEFQYGGRQGGYLIPCFSPNNGPKNPMKTAGLDWLSGSLGMLNRYLEPNEWVSLLNDLEKIKAAVDEFKTMVSDRDSSDEEAFELSC